MKKLLEIKDLKVNFHTYLGEVQAVRGVSFHVNQGEIVALVGESGCGKSVTAKSIMKLLPTAFSHYKSGEILYHSMDLLKVQEKEMETIRGNEISMIFQDPMTSLNPTSKIGEQIIEGLMKHKKVSKSEAYRKAKELLELVGIPQPEKRMNQYPHEFSGGMRQRVVIAMALVCEPQLIIADEPTTALDVTIQAQILKLIKDLQFKLNTSVILITHDLGVVAEICDRVVVMYAGEVVESGKVEEIFANPSHPYTKGLMKSVPRLDMSRNESLYSIVGSPPNLLHPPNGCAFYSRCEYAMKVCQKHSPNLMEINTTQQTACWLYHPMANPVEKESMGGM
ncbi:ABC transporter ATP-binding protein [Neobacillus niacini]|uniref:ABC transporter ATP-binding protein n=1 Tax=Neobacillus niacini TaxID=86668 RepID=UPI0021CB234B|nr:ABC transporter ATP-binding protein [Neobacillus niacini]MCM3766334.1 ABC transporter ATP-binding protein [Neobacillus niacini]